MSLNDFMTNDFFEQKYKPSKKTNTTTETTPPNIQEYEKFFGKSLLDVLGQGPIKKTPKRSEKWLQKQQQEKEKIPTLEEEKEIREIFGENTYSDYIF